MSVVVACVYRSGGDFTVEYVERLAAGVGQHLPGARFVCLSDVEVPCERIALATQWPGWWAKLELFRPGLFRGPVLYFDLDTMIVGDLAELAAYPHRFTVATNWWSPQCINSAVMAWSGSYGHLFTRFGWQSMRRYRSPARLGDQAWIGEQLGVTPERFDDLWPGALVSYKAHPPEARRGARAVLFHGRPRPHEVGWQL